MAGLPDWTLPVSIVAQEIDKLAVDIVAQTLGNLKVDIAADSLGNLPVDIKAQSVGNIKVDIAAQSLGDIGVNIKAQDLSNLNINVNAQSIGVSTINFWTAEHNEWKTITGSATVSSGSSQTIIDYTVPSGVALYISRLYMSEDPTGGAYELIVSDVTAGINFITYVDNRAKEFSFDPPITIPAGDEIQAAVGNESSGDETYYIQILGWEK